jgi:predicted dehydrogenase
MIHDVDLALFINGPAQRVEAHGLASDDMVDFASAMLRHENGRLSRIHASRITHKKVRQITATATDMFIDCDLLRKELTLSRDTEVLQAAGQPYRITATEERIEVRPQEALLSELQTFLRDVRNGKPNAEAPGAREAISAMAVCETIRSAILSAQVSTRGRTSR